MNSILISAGTFGLAGATFALPASFFICRTNRLNRDVIVVTAITTFMGAVFGALRQATNTLTAFGTFAGAFCVTHILIKKKLTDTKKAFLGYTGTVGCGMIGFFTHAVLKTNFVFSNRFILLSSLVGAFAALTYHSPWRTGKLDNDQIVDVASLAVIGGAAGYMWDMVLKGIKV